MHSASSVSRILSHLTPNTYLRRVAADVTNPLRNTGCLAFLVYMKCDATDDEFSVAKPLDY